MNDNIRLLKNKCQRELARCTRYDCDFGRDMIITPFSGHYGLAGYIIVIEGSPTHGMALLDIPRQVMLCFGFGKTVRVTEYRKRQFWLDTLSLLQLLGFPVKEGSDILPSLRIATQTKRGELLDGLLISPNVLTGHFDLTKELDQI